MVCCCNLNIKVHLKTIEGKKTVKNDDTDMKSESKVY